MTYVWFPTYHSEHILPKLRSQKATQRPCDLVYIFTKKNQCSIHHPSVRSWQDFIRELHFREIGLKPITARWDSSTAHGTGLVRISATFSKDVQYLRATLPQTAGSLYAWWRLSMCWTRDVINMSTLCNHANAALLSPCLTIGPFGGWPKSYSTFLSHEVLCSQHQKSCTLLHMCILLW